MLRIWFKGDFASFACARCGAVGWARDEDARRLDPALIAASARAAEAQTKAQHHDRLDLARWLWNRAKPIAGTPAESYLRIARGYKGRLPATLRYLPPTSSSHHPAMIAAFGHPEEPEPGTLHIRTDRIVGVHLTLIRPDGSGKAGTDRDKFMIAHSTGAPIVLAPLNDGLSLLITEGIEDALSLHEASGIGVWAAGAAVRFGPLADAVPAYCEAVLIASDPDDAGERGAAALKAGLKPRGIPSRRLILEAEDGR